MIDELAGHLLPGVPVERISSSSFMARIAP